MYGQNINIQSIYVSERPIFGVLIRSDKADVLPRWEWTEVGSNQSVNGAWK